MRHNETQIKIPCEVYSRVVGYMRPVAQWNAGKQEEFFERVSLKVPDILSEAQ
jgi:ribonucleoside-triphosphate reductase